MALPHLAERNLPVRPARPPAPRTASSTNKPPPRQKQAWENAAVDVTDPTSARKPAAAARPASATTAAAPAATDQNIHLALQQLGQALSAAAAASRPALPRDERRTMHQRQADATERQLLLLRRLRAVEPRAPALSVGQLAEALQPLAKRGTTQPAFLSRDILNTIWRRAGHGAVQRLLDELCPVPVSRGTIAAAGGDVAAAEEEAKEANDGKGGVAILQGPFDRGSGKPGTQRRGARVVKPPSPMPKMIKYRHCRTPLLVPPDFDANLITRSAQLPSSSLALARVHGYNGTGKHNRSPNLFVLPKDGRMLFCTAGVAILEDLATGQQSFYTGHDDDIVCVALHPNGELVATGQGATAGGASARLSVWEISSLKEVARVGRVLDEKVGDGVTTRPFYPGSLCAAAFGPDGRLLIGVGKDEQHLIGVWDWRKGELVAKAAGMVCRPLGVHQIAAAPEPLAIDSQGRRTLFFTLVGVTNAPKFGKLAPTGPVTAPWELTFELGKLGTLVKEPPPSMSAVAYGGASFPSPSGLKHGLTFVGGGYGSIFVFDAPNNTVALRAIKAHEGPISCLLLVGGALASGGADGFVHLFASSNPAAPSASPGALERIHTYKFKQVDAGKNVGALPPPVTSSDPNSLTAFRTKVAKEKAPEPVTAATTTAPLPTTGNEGVGGIRAIAILPLGAKRAVATNRHVQIPTLLAGTARCSLWRLEPQAGFELACGHFAKAMSVAPHPIQGDAWASCGADSQLLLWRATERMPIQRALLSKPATCVTYSSDGGLVAVGLEDGSLSVVRINSSKGGGVAKVPAQSTGGSGGIECLAFAPGSTANGGLLAIGSHDRTIRVLELVQQSGGALKLTPRCTCSGHTATVTHLDWSVDGTMIMSNCSAHEVLVWAIPSGKKVLHPMKALANVQWYSHTCYLGFPVMGIWPEGVDATHVNSCHVSDGTGGGKGAGLVLTGDDNGGLKLFNAPCVVEGAPYVEGYGHCSGITSARFLKGDRAAVSSGGADRSVMLWKVVGKGGAGQRVAPVQPDLPGLPRRQCLLQTPWKDFD